MSKLGEELKVKFSQGKVPSDADYKDLISLADPNLGQGLEILNEKGVAKIKVKEGNGSILVSDAGVAVNVDNQTVVVNNDNKLAIKLSNDSGLDVTGGLHVIHGKGIKVDNDGIAVSLATQSGIGYDSNNALKVDLPANSGLDYNKYNQLTLKVPLKVGVEANYLAQDNNGLYLTDTGIEKMKTAMASVSSEALKQAVKKTKKGAIKDGEGAPTSTESQIAAELNLAYQEGWKLDQPREAARDFLIQNYQDFKGKIFPDSGFTFTRESNYWDLYIKAPNEADEPQKFTSESLLVWKLDEKGTFQKSPLKGSYLNNQEVGLYLVIGKLSKTGLPDPSGELITQYANLYVTSTSTRCIFAAAFDLKSEAVNYVTYPVRSPWTFHAGYTDGNKAGIATAERAAKEQIEREYDRGYSNGYAIGHAKAVKDMLTPSLVINEKTCGFKTVSAEYESESIYITINKGPFERDKQKKAFSFPCTFRINGEDPPEFTSEDEVMMDVNPTTPCKFKYIHDGGGYMLLEPTSKKDLTVGFYKVNNPKVYALANVSLKGGRTVRLYLRFK